MNASPSRIAGLILAGGQSSRMHGQDKGLQPLNEQPLVAHVIARLQPQVAQIWLSANRHLTHYRAFERAVFSDNASFLGMGPLAGIASFAAHLPAEYTHIQLAPCDTPFLPADLTSRLYAMMQQTHAPAVFPQSPEGAHYSCALFERAMLSTAIEMLHNAQYSLRGWLAQQNALAVAGFDEAAFANINTPEQLQSHTQIIGMNHA